MYARASSLAGLPVISLQSGEKIGHVSRPVINIANLEVAAFFCQSGNGPCILTTRDLNQFARDCLAVNNEESLSEPGEVVRLQPLLKLNYTPLGKKVFSDTGRKLGIVNDYSINVLTNRIQKLYIRQSVLQIFFGGGLIIDRTQIIEATARRFTVRDTLIKNPALHPKAAPDINP